MAALCVIVMSHVRWFIVPYDGYPYTCATIANVERLADAVHVLYATWDSFDIDAVPVLFPDARRSLSLAVSGL